MTDEAIPLSERRFRRISQFIILLSPNADYSFEGTIQRDEFSCREGFGGWPVYSRALICPYCLRCWAQLRVTTQDYFSLEPVSCLQCNRSTELNPIPGSLLDSQICNGIDWGLIDVLPEPLLRREFNLTLEAIK
jgi:hypothetical protein